MSLESLSPPQSALPSLLATPTGDPARPDNAGGVRRKDREGKGQEKAGQHPDGSLKLRVRASLWKRCWRSGVTVRRDPAGCTDPAGPARRCCRRPLEGWAALTRSACQDRGPEGPGAAGTQPGPKASDPGPHYILRRPAAHLIHIRSHCAGGETEAGSACHPEPPSQTSSGNLWTLSRASPPP